MLTSICQICLVMPAPPQFPDDRHNGDTVTRFNKVVKLCWYFNWQCGRMCTIRKLVSPQVSGGGDTLGSQDHITPIAKQFMLLEMAYFGAQGILLMPGLARNLLYEFPMITSMGCECEEKIDEANITVQNACILEGSLMSYQQFNEHSKPIDDNLTHQ